MRRLPLVDRFRIRKPCPLKWEDMVGDEKTRFCNVCNKNVHDLGSRTREEAEELIASGSACVRVKVSVAVPLVAAAAVVFSLTAACSGATEEDPTPQVGPEPATSAEAIDADGGVQEIHMLGDISEDPGPAVTK